MRQSPEANPVVAALLRTGAYGSLGLLALGLLLEIAGMGEGGRSLMRAGIFVLLATPPARVLMVAAVFLREGERRHGLISLVVLAIVLGSWALAVLRG